MQNNVFKIIYFLQISQKISFWKSSPFKKWKSSPFTTLKGLLMAMILTTFELTSVHVTAKKVSVFGVFLRIFPYSVRMRENTDQKNSEYEHFLRSVFPEILGDKKCPRISKTYNKQRC